MHLQSSFLLLVLQHKNKKCGQERKREGEREEERKREREEERKREREELFKCLLPSVSSLLPFVWFGPFHGSQKCRTYKTSIIVLMWNPKMKPGFMRLAEIGRAHV